jgi:hypothetical protein
VEAHESDLSVASEVTQARVTEALKLGAETYEGELEMEFQTLPDRIASAARSNRDDNERKRRGKVIEHCGARCRGRVGLDWAAILFGRFEISAHGAVAVQGRRIVLERGLGMQMNGWHVVDVDHETKPVR